MASFIEIRKLSNLRNRKNTNANGLHKNSYKILSIIEPSVDSRSMSNFKEIGNLKGCTFIKKRCNNIAYSNSIQESYYGKQNIGVYSSYTRRFKE